MKKTKTIMAVCLLFALTSCENSTDGMGLTKLLTFAIPAAVAFILLVYILKLRRIVPTNLVHIVQRGKNTVSYGKGKEGGNVYYEWPSWIPSLGVDVRSLPVSNFNIDINDYTAYDKDRLPFNVHVKAFFHIDDTNKAAEKVGSYQDLNKQLEDVVKGAIRSILANETLHKIMEERTVFGSEFTKQVNGDVQQWGVSTIKNLELMDIKDVSGSHVIEQIMEMKKSSIAMESRTAIAKNNKMAEQAELEAAQQIAVTKAETEKLSGEALAQSKQAVGIAQAMSDKMSGIAKQESASEIAKAEKATAEQQMEVLRIKQTKQAEIDKMAAITGYEQDQKRIEIDASAQKMKIETEAEAALSAKKKEADGIKAIGEAEASIIEAKGKASAESEKLRQLASVEAQIALADKIGKDDKYQEYMINMKKVEVSQVVGVAQYESMAKGMEGADLKFIVNSGDVNSGINKLTDVFTSKGASSVNGFLETFAHSEVGKEIIAGLIAKFGTGTDK